MELDESDTIPGVTVANVRASGLRGHLGYAPGRALVVQHVEALSRPPPLLGRGTCSPRGIIDPLASHYFAVPPACFAFLVWRFCLRVFAGAF